MRGQEDLPKILHLHLHLTAGLKVVSPLKQQPRQKISYLQHSQLESLVRSQFDLRLRSTLSLPSMKSELQLWFLKSEKVEVWSNSLKFKLTDLPAGCLEVGSGGTYSGGGGVGAEAIRLSNSMVFVFHTHFFTIFFILCGFFFESKQILDKKLRLDCIWRTFNSPLVSLLGVRLVSQFLFIFCWSQNNFLWHFSTSNFKFQLFYQVKPGKNLNMMGEFCIRSIRILYLKWRPTCTTKAQPRGFWDWRGTALYVTVNISGRILDFPRERW